MNARTRFHPSSFILHPSPAARGKPRRYATALRHSSFIIHHSSFPRNAFTLVEMLVVIVILTMLAGMVMFAIRGAQESARQSKTKATIQKLDSIVVELYESYDTRRVPLSEAEMQLIAQARLGWNPATMPWTLTWVARVRLAALRDLMRMEMPERWSDITTAPQYVTTPPALYQAYRTRYSSGPPPVDAYYPAKCLYLLVSMAGGEDARSQFAPDEVATDPNDGFSMFIDGWGRPIYFLRWAPGFNDSDLQPNIVPPADAGAMAAASQNDHDPFDPRRVDPAAWRLVPLIYSAGRDGEYGLWMKPKIEPPYYTWTNNTYVPISDPDFGQVLMGQPVLPTHYDNIHNHRVETP